MKRLTTQRRAAFPTLEPAEPPKQFSALETPVPIVDLDRLAQNLDRMASYCILHGLSLRPHVKTHKSPRIAADQMRLGAIGLTCATPRELEVMGDVSHDLLLAYPLVRRHEARPRDVHPASGEADGRSGLGSSV